MKQIGKPWTTEENYVTCIICGKTMKAITNTHLYRHGMNAKMYHKKYPFIQTCSISTLEKNRESSLKAVSEGKIKWLTKGNKLKQKYRKLFKKRMKKNNPMFNKVIANHVSKIQKLESETGYKKGSVGFKVTKDILVQKYVKEKKELSEIGKELGISKEVLRKRMKDFGVNPRYGKIDIPKNVLYKKYIIERKTSIEIAKELGCSKRTILANLYFYGIPVRSVFSKRSKTLKKTFTILKLLNKGYCAEKIAQKMKINSSYVYKTIRKFVNLDYISQKKTYTITKKGGIVIDDFNIMVKDIIKSDLGINPNSDLTIRGGK